MIYYLRFMYYGVRRLWPGGTWTLWQAGKAIHHEYIHQEPSERWRPDSDVDEALESWSD